MKLGKIDYSIETNYPDFEIQLSFEIPRGKLTSFFTSMRSKWPGMREVHFEKVEKEELQLPEKAHLPIMGMLKKPLEEILKGLKDRRDFNPVSYKIKDAKLMKNDDGSYKGVAYYSGVYA